MNREDENPITGAWINSIIRLTPKSVQVALKWCPYLPLDVVLQMPWDVNDCSRSALLKFHWSTRDFSKILTGYGDAVEQGLWPFRPVRVPLVLLAETIALPRSMWSDVADYRAGIPISQDLCMALLVSERNSLFGLRPLEMRDVRDAIASALRISD